MSSTLMMQNMCNTQTTNDLGLYGAQYNQVNYGSAFSPAPVGSEYAGGPTLVNPQTLAMPPMNYSGCLSPQNFPMGMPAISPPPAMLPMMDMNMPSLSPPPMAPYMDVTLSSVSPSPMAMSSGLVTLPMMGYSVLPLPQGGMNYLNMSQPSASPENQHFYLLPEIALTPPGYSISRSCSPVSDIALASELPSNIKEVARERLPSASSVSSLDSTGSGVISKKELVEDCLNKIDQIFGSRVQTTGMRGPTVMRIKVKTRPALELIVHLLRTLEQNCNIIAISCPKSTKKGKQHIRGFLAYIQTNTVADIAQVQRVYDEFNFTHTNGEDAAPFKSLEVNPQKKN